MTYRKKLIEVALPLEAINVASAREKEPFTRNHPRSLHIWWARRPLAACRAVLFASLVDDPSEHPEQFPTELDQDRERQRLFRLIEELVKWENSNNERVLGMARDEIMKATNGNPPTVLDPFCGGGSIPLEAQRLGLEAHGSDLNPVAVLITKALIEIPPKFANKPPVNPEARSRFGGDWRGAHGLAEDVRYYGQWMRDEAQKRIGHLYPKAKLPLEQGGGDATVIAWIWARTVKCPNPACGAQMPLVRSFALSTKPGKKAWVEPVVDRTQHPPTIHFHVQTGNGEPPDPPKVGRGAKFKCLACETIAPDQHIKDEGKAGRMGAQLMAIVAEGRNGRVYLPPSPEHEEVAASARPDWKPEQELANDPRNIWCVNYGLTTFADLFTPRQLVALTTFSDLVGEARERAKQDALAAGLPDDGVGLDAGGSGAQAYAEALGVYLGLSLSRWSDLSNAICSWNSTNQNIRALFARQAIPMSWDFAEVFPFGSVAPIDSTLASTANAIQGVPASIVSKAKQLDATEAVNGASRPVISTDPPYYDNIGYADLADFFYMWLRRSLGRVYPSLFSTLLVPKSQELVATPYRFGGSREKARHFFEEGLGKAFAQMRIVAHPYYPLTVYYAFKQSEADDDDNGASAGALSLSSTGWETMLEGLLKASFQITGTWPMRTERIARSISIGTNALASSIVLVCRPRPADAPLTTRRDFLNALKRELPTALKQLQHGNIAPVDLAQAAIGPGMAVFSRYSKVMESDGTSMRVRTALQLINQALDQVLAEQEGEYDADTRWAVAWFEQYAHNEGPYGVAETLSKAKNTAVGGLVEAGFLRASGGKVSLLRRDELPEGWDPTTDKRLTVWEATQHLIRALDREGERGAAALLNKVGGDYGERARDLAYRLYTTCERKKWAQEAQAYNSLVVAWPQITQRAGEMQGEMAQGRFG